MRLAPRLLFSLVSLWTVPTAAQDVWQENGQTAPEERFRAARDGFGVMMLVTDDSEGFWRAWDGPTPPNLPTTDRTVRGRPVNGMIIFFGCMTGADGNCDVTAQFVFLRPDGSPYGETLSGPVWRGPPAPGANLQLSESSVGLIVEPEDPIGVWTLRAIVTDNVRRVTISVEQEVTVEPSAAAAPVV